MKDRGYTSVFLIGCFALLLILAFFKGNELQARYNWRLETYQLSESREPASLASKQQVSAALFTIGCGLGLALAYVVAKARGRKVDLVRTLFFYLLTSLIMSPISVLTAVSLNERAVSPPGQLGLVCKLVQLIVFTALVGWQVNILPQLRHMDQASRLVKGVRR